MIKEPFFHIKLIFPNKWTFSKISYNFEILIKKFFNLQNFEYLFKKIPNVKKFWKISQRLN